MSQNKEGNSLNKTVRINVKMTNAERSLIQLKAKNAGYNSMSKYVRDILLKTSIVPKADAELILQVRRIGTNVNQLTRLSNEKKDLYTLNSVYNDMDTEIKELIKLITNAIIK